MEVTENYTDLKERTEKINLQEGLGMRMLHDDFDPSWQTGNEPHGTMTFTDVMPLTIIHEPVRDLAKELDDLKIRVASLEIK